MHSVLSYVQCVSSLFMICFSWLMFIIWNLFLRIKVYLFLFISFKTFQFCSDKFDCSRLKWLPELRLFFEVKIFTFTEVQIVCSC